MTADDRWLLPAGIEELLPPKARQLDWFQRKVADQFERWGYDLVVPPYLDYLESLLTGTSADLDLQTAKGYRPTIGAPTRFASRYDTAGCPHRCPPYESDERSGAAVLRRTGVSRNAQSFCRQSHPAAGRRGIIWARRPDE